MASLWDELVGSSRWYGVGSARWIGHAVGCPAAALDMRPVGIDTYPDGEIRMDLPAAPTPISVVVGRADDERSRRMQLPSLCLIHAACLAARQHGATRVVAVMPEIPYLRQERPTPGTTELAARDWVAALLDLPALDAVVTWQPKPDLAPLLRSTSLVMPGLGAVAAAIAAALPRGPGGVDVVVAPDHGATRLATAVAAHIGGTFQQLVKRRLNAQDVVVTQAPPSDRRRHLVVDDMYVSGGTLLAAVQALGAADGPAVCYVGNFRPTALGRERLRSMLDSGLVDTVLVPRYYLTTRTDPRIVGIDTTSAMRAALVRAAMPHSDSRSAECTDG